MQAYVFTDKSLARYAGQFVWLAVDIEKPQNAPFLTKFTMEGVPTFYIVDPRTEDVALRLLGSATVEQLAKILDDGKKAVSGSSGNLEQLLARADALFGAGKNAEAAKAYQAALSVAPREWSSFGRATENLLFSLSSSDQPAVCAEKARASFPKLRNTSSAANVAAVGLDCALSIPPENPSRRQFIVFLERNAREVLSNRKVVVAADDRSGVYQVLIAAREDSKDEAGKRKLVNEWSAFLDAEAAKATNSAARAVFDPHRLSAYLEMGKPELAVPMLTASEKDFPDDYNPPARLALAYKAMKRYDDAIAASDRALARVYGPRKIVVLRGRADIFEARGDKPKARRTIEEAVKVAQALPAGQRSDRTIAALKKRLDTLKDETPGG